MFAAISASALALSYIDLTRRRLPNRLVLVLSIAVLLALALADPPGEGTGSVVAVLAGLAAGLIGFATYRADLIAGGDVKILPALVALEIWMGSTPQLIYLAITIAAGLIALIWFIRQSPNTPPTGIPLGTVLLIGVAPSATMIAPL